MLQKFIELLDDEEVGNIKNRVTLLHSDLSTLPFPDETFDTIYCCVVLAHNPYEGTQKIIQEFQRLLKPQGKAILIGAFQNLYSLEGIQNFIYSTFFVEKWKNGPIRAYTRSKVRNLFKEWSEATIIPVEAMIIPKQIGTLQLPFRKHIKQLNHWVEQKDFTFISKTSVFVRHFNVIATK